MKKVKLTILSLAFLFSICAAFATKPHWDCTSLQQYYWNGQIYIQATSQFACMQGGGTCTYYTLNGGITFSPCTVGTYNGCPGCLVETPNSNVNASH